MCNIRFYYPFTGKKIKKAGLDAYNHNIDTSPEFYKKIISTRTFEERLKTIKNVSDAGISVCCGGIIGMGETWDDRAKMLEVLVNLDPKPESVPLNALVPVRGTPLKINLQLTLLRWLEWLLQHGFYYLKQGLGYQQEEKIF